MPVKNDGKFGGVLSELDKLALKAGIECSVGIGSGWYWFGRAGKAGEENLIM